jgi:hypothetical protein
VEERSGLGQPSPPSFSEALLGTGIQLAIEIYPEGPTLFARATQPRLWTAEP